MKYTKIDTRIRSYKFKMEIEPREVDEIIKEVYDYYRKKFPVNGWSRGNAPDDILEKQYGARIREDIKKSVVYDKILEACNKENLKYLDSSNAQLITPRIEKGKPYAFMIDVLCQEEPEKPKGEPDKKERKEREDERRKHSGQSKRSQNEDKPDNKGDTGDHVPPGSTPEERK